MIDLEGFYQLVLETEKRRERRGGIVFPSLGGRKASGHIARNPLFLPALSSAPREGTQASPKGYL